MTGKIAVLNLKYISDPERRVTIYDIPSKGKYVDPMMLENLLDTIFPSWSGFLDDTLFFIEKSGTGQRVKGLHTAAVNCGITYAICSLFGYAHLVPSVTWQAHMRTYADVNGWSNKEADRRTKNLPSLIAHAFAPDLATDVHNKTIDIDDNVADAICLALYGAMQEDIIDKIFIKG